MIAYFEHRIDRIAVRSAAVFYVLGTLLFLTVLTGQRDVLAGLCIAFLFFAVAVSLLILLSLFIVLLKHPKQIEQHALAALLVLLNYPVAGLYIYSLS